MNASNEQEGPVALGDLQEMLKQSRLSLSTYVFSEGMENWTPASQVDAISSGGAGLRVSPESARIATRARHRCAAAEGVNMMGPNVRFTAV